MARNKIKKRPERWKRVRIGWYSNIVDRIPENRIREELRKITIIRKITLRDIKRVRSIIKMYIFNLNYDYYPLESEVSYALASISQGASNLLGKIEGANDAVKYKLARESRGDRNVVIDPETLTWTETPALDLGDVIAALKTLSRWATEARERGDSAHAGRPSDDAPAHAIVALAALYEDLSGRTANPPGLMAGNRAGGAFPKFANAILGLMGNGRKERITRHAVRKWRANEMAKMQKIDGQLTPLDVCVRMMPD
jgi:hypothetical protein